MKREAVASSNIKSVGFDGLEYPADHNTGTLEIEFKSGGVYQYANVPAGCYVAFINAASKGTFFQQRIKPVYACKRV